MRLVEDRWYIVLQADEVPRGRPLGVTRHGVALVFWRDGEGVVRCASDRCPHRGAALSLGHVREGTIACPFHGFRFRGDGQCVHMPPQGDRPPPKGYGVRAYDVREAHGFVWLWWGVPREDPPPIPWFHDLDAPGWRWRRSAFADTWPIHWTRVVENQLDFTHLPFVHGTSIGRGLAHEVDVTVEGDGDHLVARASNQSAVLELVAPNLWRNRLGAKVYAMMIFTPIDEDHTRIYVRMYQRLVPWPVLGELFCLLSRWPNRFIMGQDKAVVLSQRPGEASLRNGEALVRSDAPIIWFRRWLDRHGPTGGSAPTEEAPTG